MVMSAAYGGYTTRVIRKVVDDETEEYEFDMNIMNCLWHNWGSVMEQGSDIAPRYTMCCSPPLLNIKSSYQSAY